LEEDESQFSGIVYCAKQPVGAFTSPNNPPQFIFACVEAGRLIPPTSQSCGEVRQVSFYTSFAYGRTSFGIECIRGEEEKVAIVFLSPLLESGYAILLRIGQKNHFEFLR
jgi:hypothetical protein